MATMNLFELLGGDDAEDPTLLVAASLKVDKTKKATAGAQPPASQAKSGAGKLPTKPLPPAQAVKESRNDMGRGGGRGGRGYGGGRGRGGGGFNRDSGNIESTYGGNNGFSGGYNRPSEEGEGKTSERKGGYGGPRGGGFRGGRRGGFSNAEGGDEERPRRTFERHSGTGRGNEFKREGAGRGNWGTPTDEIALETEEPVNEIEKNVVAEKQVGEEDVTDVNKDAPVNDEAEKEQEDKEMTLEEYEKVREEKRKALLALKTEVRKVIVDKEFESMQQLSNKKTGDEIFIKLGSEKDKRKEAADKEEKAKKSVSITEFLKPAEGERYFGGGRGRGRGRGSRGGYSHGGSEVSVAKAPSIQDPASFPSLGGK